MASRGGSLQSAALFRPKWRPPAAKVADRIVRLVRSGEIE
jgi:hypothetical protein